MSDWGVVSGLTLGQSVTIGAIAVVVAVGVWTVFSLVGTGIALACVAALVLTSTVHGPLRRLSLGLGYASLALFLLTLATGPWTVIRGRRMPVSTMFRRDVGIWAGLTGCLHVVFGLQSHFDGRIALLRSGPCGARRRI
ncbi:MAG: hypothetical protein H0V51_25280 [Chloroflexi bacterium]|nr:hypothetical protein [Chloroflexota bacterium]